MKRRDFITATGAAIVTGMSVVFGRPRSKAVVGVDQTRDGLTLHGPKVVAASAMFLLADENGQIRVHIKDSFNWAGYMACQSKS